MTESEMQMMIAMYKEIIAVLKEIKSLEAKIIRTVSNALARFPQSGTLSTVESNEEQFSRHDEVMKKFISDKIDSLGAKPKRSGINTPQGASCYAKDGFVSTHIRIAVGGQSIELWRSEPIRITSAAVWKYMDLLVMAHISSPEGNPEKVKIPSKWWKNIYRPKYRILLKYIHREKTCELNQPKNRNEKFTGYAYLKFGG